MRNVADSEVSWMIFMRTTTQVGCGGRLHHTVHSTYTGWWGDVERLSTAHAATQQVFPWGGESVHAYAQLSPTHNPLLATIPQYAQHQPDAEPVKTASDLGFCFGAYNLIKNCKSEKARSPTLSASPLPSSLLLPPTRRMPLWIP
jgi:hypothetical protein